MKSPYINGGSKVVVKGGGFQQDQSVTIDLNKAKQQNFDGNKGSIHHLKRKNPNCKLSKIFI